MVMVIVSGCSLRDTRRVAEKGRESKGEACVVLGGAPKHRLVVDNVD